MGKKRHKTEKNGAKLQQFEVLTAQRRTMIEAVRSIAATEVTHDRWRSECGNLKGDLAKRLRRAVPDLTIEKSILKEAAHGT
jgi:hypothetical protein